jgi:hypothetical protein
MAKAKSSSSKIGRNAGTGKFEPVKAAQIDKKGAIVQTFKKAAKKK